MLSNLLQKLFAKSNKEAKQRDFEWEKFQKTAKEQFIWLREKGIRIPIVSL